MNKAVAKRIALASALAAGLPFLIGFLAGVSGLLRSPGTAPDWVLVVRVSMSWVAVIAVFTWFSVVQRGRLVRHAAVVVVVAWVLSQLMGAAARLVITKATGEVAEIWSFSLQGLLIAIVRAVIGVTLGLALRFKGPGSQALFAGNQRDAGGQG